MPLDLVLAQLVRTTDRSLLNVMKETQCALYTDDTFDRALIRRQLHPQSIYDSQLVVRVRDRM